MDDDIINCNKKLSLLNNNNLMHNTNIHVDSRGSQSLDIHNIDIILVAPTHNSFEWKQSKLLGTIVNSYFLNVLENRLPPPNTNSS